MKLKILSTIAVAMLTTGAFGQYILLDNANNSGGPTATSNGQIYTQSWYGGSPSLFDGIDYDLGVTVFAGPNPNMLALMGTFTPANDPKGYTGFDYGKFQLGGAGLAVQVPGVSMGGPAYIELEMWIYDGPNATGTFQSYPAAVAGLDPLASVTFEQPYTGSVAIVPPRPPQELTGMPSVIFYVPEPTTLALAGLGLASLLAFRRK